MSKILLFFLCSLYYYILAVTAQDFVLEPCMLHDCDSLCMLPKFPKNGEYSLQGFGEPATLNTDALVRNGTILYYTCYPGFKPFSTSTTICLQGKWTGEFDRCEKSDDESMPGGYKPCGIINCKECTLPEQPANGRYLILGSTNLTPYPGDLVQNTTILHYICDSGFKPIDAAIAICHEGDWATKFKECRTTKFCALPEVPANGEYTITGVVSLPSPGTEMQEWTTLTFSCEPSYELVGSQLLLCHGGIWTANPPECKKIPHCVMPDVPHNGRYEIVGLEYLPSQGDLVRETSSLFYSCHDGYTLIGGAVSLCEKGAWLGGLPQCKEFKSCVLPEYPEHGSYTMLDSNTPVVPSLPAADRDTIEFHCLPGFQLAGAPCSTCLDGKWTVGIPRCIELKTCLIPSPPKRGSYAVIGSGTPAVEGLTVEEWRTLQFTCQPGLNLVGKETSTCYGGKWTNETPRCIDSKSCILPEIPVNTVYRIVGPESEVGYTAGAGLEEGTLMLFSCDVTYNMMGSSSMYCDNSQWSNKIPQCLKYEECYCIESQASGVYYIQPAGFPTGFLAYCDLQLNGQKWIVIQRRINGSLDFYRNYQSYTDGFGSADGELWLGLERIHQLTKYNKYELFVDLEAFDGTRRFARYSEFNVGDSKSGYKLTVGGFSGDAGDSLVYHNGMKFSTFDKDQDASQNNCAQKETGGWWYNECHQSHLNGKYYTSPVDNTAATSWYHMFNNRVSLKATRMLIRKKSGF